MRKLQENPSWKLLTKNSIGVYCSFQYLPSLTQPLLVIAQYIFTIFRCCWESHAVRKCTGMMYLRKRYIIIYKKFFRYSLYRHKSTSKTHKLLQICKQVAARLLSSRYQDVFALLVPSCCDMSGTSCYHLVTRLMTVTDLLQVVPTRLIQAVRNKLLRACCHRLVINNLLRADDIRLVGTTCCESVGLINLVTR